MIIFNYIYIIITIIITIIIIIVITIIIIIQATRPKSPHRGTLEEEVVQFFDDAWHLSASLDATKSDISSGSQTSQRTIRYACSFFKWTRYLSMVYFWVPCLRKPDGNHEESEECSEKFGNPG